MAWSTSISIPARTRPRLQRPAGRLIFTGNLAEYQGIDLMLKAFAAALPRIPAARLRIASDSSFEPYEALARELGIRQQIDIISSPSLQRTAGAACWPATWLSTHGWTATGCR